VSQRPEHLFGHCSRWSDQHRDLWKAVGKATGWKAGRCRHVPISELFTIGECPNEEGAERSGLRA